MDTWATSSLTPQLACGWLTDPELYAITYPMDLRPQAHDIIRTWLFATIVRSHLESGTTPWKHAALSGWILDPDRKKMSKSRGNVVTPEYLIDEHGADGVRYWAANGRPGTDTAFEPQQMKVGRRLATKLLNAAKFVYSFGEAAQGAVITEPLDHALIGEFEATAAEATTALDAYEYTSALIAAERFFWTFCDDYLELVKDRAYGAGSDVSGGRAGTDSARMTLRAALDGVIQLLAPFIPFTTEEVWSWTHDSSAHTSTWPTAADSAAEGHSADHRGLLATASTAIGAVRRAKTERKLSMRTEVPSAEISGPAAFVADVRLFEDDLKAAGHINSLTFTPASDVAATLYM